MTKEKYFEAKELDRKIKRVQKLIVIVSEGQGNGLQINHNRHIMAEKFEDAEVSVILHALERYREILMAEFDEV